MTVTEFLQHHGIVENPFRGEEARSDAVFQRMDARHAGLHHSDFEKILGDPRRPSSSVVFGEKGSGKTAIRLQIAERIDEHNKTNAAAKVLLVGYDDWNGVLGRLSDRVGGKTPLESLQKTRLVDHIDAILHMIVPRVVDAVLGDSYDAQPLDLGAAEKKPARRLDPIARRDLVLLQTLYDRPDGADLRTRILRRRLRVGPPLGRILTGAAAALGPFILGGAFIALKQYMPDFLNNRLVVWGLYAALGIYAVILIKAVVWNRLADLRIAREVRRQLRVVARGDVSFGRSLRQLGPAMRDHGALPVSDSDEPRYAMLDRLRRVLRCFGYAGLLIIIDRVDEPTLVSGDPDRMKAVVWPLLNNKFLQHEGVGVKMLLPVDLRHALFKESSAFFQEARLDKQALVERLSWTGSMLYDLCEARLNACRHSAAANASVMDLFAEDVSRQDVVDALDQMHQPRDAFKMLYRCLSEHCSNVTRDQNQWRIPRHVLESVKRQEVERVTQLYRGISPG